MQTDAEQLLIAKECIRYDAVLVKLALESFRLVLPYASDRLRADRSMTAVTHNGLALQYAAPYLRADRAVVLAALGRRTGSALEFASPELRAHRRICEVALRSGKGAFPFVAELYKSDRLMALTAVRQNGQVAPREANTDRAATALFRALLAQGENTLVLTKITPAAGPHLTPKGV